jgi:hypothetical protein
MMIVPILVLLFVGVVSYRRSGRREFAFAPGRSAIPCARLGQILPVDLIVAQPASAS